MPEGTLGWAIERYRNQKIKFSNDERDFLTAAQIAGLIQKLTLAEFDQQVVNVCTGIATSVRSAASLLLGKGSELDPHFESGKSNVPRIIGDASNLRKILNLSAEELKWRYLM
jgi:hypothetical protein